MKTKTKITPTGSPLTASTKAGTVLKEGSPVMFSTTCPGGTIYDGTVVSLFREKGTAKAVVRYARRPYNHHNYDEVHAVENLVTKEEVAKDLRDMGRCLRNKH